MGYMLVGAGITLAGVFFGYAIAVQAVKEYKKGQRGDH